MTAAVVAAVWASATHSFSKVAQRELTLIAGQGVAGDAHCGVTVKHRSRVAKDPTQLNLRQVHLIQGELFDGLARRGFGVQPGQLGENLTTRGIDLLALPCDTELRIGADVLLRLTGLRNPCPQIENFEAGLLKAVVDKDANGEIVRKAGVMSVVLAGGVVRPGDRISVRLPALPHAKLERV
ncbi:MULTISPECIES: MOSC domain-containing protein [unclassified Roseateles]|uniref:MOSC domain-containing protein n=1 Tax=unclassified Roseateles TaxID=2626991 RepID=UPI0006F36B01|nr:MULTISPECIES: MOSC domain-containing protein [unclassified Roseateles]KQW43608.1 molybdenum cofactor biosysynthesis protein [Pelomonas sp. Root405]KRA71346.1 molybdenum cofactor biosysynthesis protein [Pelomonas sp. Root662]